MLPKYSKPGVVGCRSARTTYNHLYSPPALKNTFNPPSVKEKVPTFVRILGIDGAGGVTSTARGPGNHARMLAGTAAGFRLGEV